MSNSKKRNISAGGKSTAKAAGAGKSNTTGPKVSGKKPAAKSREKALADARRATSRGNSQMTTWIIAAVVVLGLVVAGVIAVVNNNKDKEAAAAARDLGAGTVSVEDGSITWGDEAPAKVEYWIDLLCPACRTFETAAAPTIENAVANGEAQLVVYPTAILNNASNPPGYSARAGAALLCAAEQPEGYQFMKQLYEQQPPEGSPGLSDDELAEIASEVGLGTEWSTCYDNGTYADVPEQNNQTFDANGFTGTPTALVNGTQLTQRTPEELQQMIDAAQS